MSPPCSLRLYLQLFVGGVMSYLRYVHFVFISSCLYEGSCLINVMLRHEPSYKQLEVKTK
jgi:hypothetical protein